MDRNSVILAALAPSRGKFLTPVQIQKLLFLIDRNVPEKIQGPHFDFQPYHYGTFDKSIYSLLDELAEKKLIQIIETGCSWKKYGLTPEGQSIAESYLNSLDEKTRAYIQRLSNFVLALSFEQLVSAIYKAYPEMKQNSVFKE